MKITMLLYLIFSLSFASSTQTTDDFESLLDIFSYEVIGFISITLLLIIIKLFRKSDSPKKEKTSIKPIVVDTKKVKEKQKKKDIEPKDQEKKTLKKEKISEEKILIEEVKNPININTTSIYKKREVPPHKKIMKNDFMEFSGLRILVAEDNFINQKVLIGILAYTGIELVIANDGVEALNILEKDRNFGLILMDVHMPNMDGLETTRAIRADPEINHFVIVALSGDTAPDDIKKTAEAGMQDHLEKPLKMDSLYDIIYAYTDEEIQNDKLIDDVVSTKELNIDKGLEICGGDETFYREILQEFINTYESSTDKLHELLLSEKMKEADKLLLDLIGITANIGADQLHDISQDIKEALKDTHEKSYMTLLQQYKKHINELIKDIKEYL